jgi:hypothetical protein
MQLLVAVQSHSFAILLPIIVVIVCFLSVAVPAARIDGILRQRAGAATSVRIRFGEFTLVVPKDRFLAYGFERAAYSAQGFVTTVNVPAAFVASAVSLLVAKRPRWAPPGMMPWQWLVLTYPLYSVPAWIFVGWALDTCIHRRQMRAAIAWASTLLSCASGSLAIGLRFGMTESERANPDLLQSYIVGFAIWACLLLIPCIALLRSQRGKRQLARSCPTEPGIAE